MSILISILVLFVNAREKWKRSYSSCAFVMISTCICYYFVLSHFSLKRHWNSLVAGWVYRRSGGWNGTHNHFLTECWAIPCPRSKFSVFQPGRLFSLQVILCIFREPWSKVVFPCFAMYLACKIIGNSEQVSSPMACSCVQNSCDSWWRGEDTPDIKWHQEHAKFKPKRFLGKGGSLLLLV